MYTPWGSFLMQMDLVIVHRLHDWEPSTQSTTSQKPIRAFLYNMMFPPVHTWRHTHTEALACLGEGWMQGGALVSYHPVQRQRHGHPPYRQPARRPTQAFLYNIPPPGPPSVCICLFFN